VKTPRQWVDFFYEVEDMSLETFVKLVQLEARADSYDRLAEKLTQPQTTKDTTNVPDAK